MTTTLFPGLPELPEPPAHEEAVDTVERAPRLRLSSPVRDVVRLRAMSIDSLLPPEHAARIVWAYAESLDVSPLLAGLKVVEGEAGRSAIDPRVMLALWLFATVDGVGSAREIARLCREHAAYVWIGGEVEVGRTKLADFRVSSEAFLDEILARGVAALVAEGLVTLERVAQDGMRVRASAGAASFRREGKLASALAEATAQVEALKQELDGDDAIASRRRAAARARGAADRAARLQRALEHVPEATEAWARNQKKRGGSKGGKAGGATPAGAATPGSPASPTGAATPASGTSAPRVSSTDPEARVMKMGDGGFRPAFNCQMATDVGSIVIVAVDTWNTGSDQGLHGPMVDDVVEKYGRVPGAWLVDAGFPTLESTDALPDGLLLFGPPVSPRDPGRDPAARLRGDSDRVAEWRARMATPEGKEPYKARSATAELVNAHARNRGLQQFRTRGMRGANCELLLQAVAHNLLRAHHLRAAARK